MMSGRRYEMPWRNAFELYAAIAWSSGGMLFILLADRAGHALAVPFALGAACLMVALVRGTQAWRVLRLRAALGGRAMQTMTPRAISQLLRRRGATVPRFWLRMASGALAAPVRTRQGSLSATLAAARVAPARSSGQRRARSRMRKSDCRIFTASSPASERSIGRCRTSRAARSSSARPSPARVSPCRCSFRRRYTGATS